MNKSQLTNFITKYTLGGEIKSTKWTSNGDSLSTRFISGDKSVVGRVELNKFSHLKPCELGVYNTGQLTSLLSVLGDDVEVKLSNSGDKFISMELEDTKRKTKSKYMLSDLSVIPTPPELKNLPDSFELGIKVDPYFVSTFISGKGALSEAETFTILTENGETKITGFSPSCNDSYWINYSISGDEVIKEPFLVNTHCNEPYYDIYHWWHQ